MVVNSWKFKVRFSINCACIFLLSSLSSCLLGPDYTNPNHYVPDEWVQPPVETDLEVIDEEPMAQWWQLFNDCLLNEYIELAVCYNNNIKTAESNVLQARALRVVAASGLFPQINADFNGSKTYFSKNGPLFAIEDPGNGGQLLNNRSPFGSSFSIQIPQIQSLYNATLDASWEIDLFGKIRRGVEAADDNYQAAIEQRNDVLVSVLAELATNYIDVRSLQKRLTLTEENVSLLQQNVKLVNDRYKSGVASLLDLERIEAELSTQISTMPNIYAQLYRSIYAISVLTGALPETLFDELVCAKDLPELPVQIAVGLRSDIMRRRPDIRHAERQLAAATANIGVAVASFFPTINLFGQAGFQSLNFNNLFSGGSKTWSFGGDVFMPIFQGGKLCGNLQANEAATSAAYYTYQQTVLNALREAETALSNVLQDRATSDLLAQTVAKTRKISELTNLRYKSGLVSMTDLIDSDRQLISTELNLLDSKTAALNDFIALYKALGGGWECF